MSYHIAFANQKGGVGKTTLTMGTAGVLSEMGKSILLVDMDQQANLSSAFIDQVHTLSPTVADMLIDDEDVGNIIRQTEFDGIDLIPANLALSDLDTRLAGDDDAQFYLLESLQDISDRYDYILIDCPPNLGRATRMALVAAHGLLVPIECQEWAVKGSSQIQTYVDRVRRRANPDLRVLGFVINKYEKRRSLETTYNQVLRDTYLDQIFRTEFNNHVQYTEAATAKQPVNYYLPKSTQANVFREFTKELLSYVEKEQAA
jgi:chromosome partitioning protein